MYIKDNYDLFDEKERADAEWLEGRPICSCCKEPITAEKAICINGEWYCDECIKEEFTQYID